MEAATRVLAVDDEPDNLKIITSLLKSDRFIVEHALSGEQCLNILEDFVPDVVLLDIVMPGMDGYAVCQAIRANPKFKYTKIIFLSGKSKSEERLQGYSVGVDDYLTKPFEFAELVAKIDVFDRLNKMEKQLHELNEALQEQISIQKRQQLLLEELNATLEAKVAERTAELEKAYAKLQTSYYTAIPIFANLVELQEHAAESNSREMAEYVRSIANRLQLPEKESQDIYFAALLHNIGKIGLPDKLCKKPYFAMTEQEQKIFQKHPVMAESALIELEVMQLTASFIRHQHEYINGKGYPDKLAGLRIPLGARILSIVVDFFDAQRGLLFDEKMTQREAIVYLESHSNDRYDKNIVRIFLEMLNTVEHTEVKSKDWIVTGSELESGMVLAEDLHSPEGILLLTKGCELTTGIISKVQLLQEQMDAPLMLKISHDNLSAKKA
jgi:response regulator RpfG family c-di-GMP phosphodiesterase